MLFSRDVYKVGARCPFVYGRYESVAADAKAPRSLYFTGLFANATDIANLPKLSPWHAIMARPSVHENVYNYINEVPMASKNATTAMALGEAFNPLKTIAAEKGAAAAAPLPFNYGCLPRTYSDANVADASFAKYAASATAAAGKKASSSSSSAAVGDGAAIDVIELSGSPLPIGMVSQVRVLGAIATTRKSSSSSAASVVDWKILAANIDDDALLSINDVPEAQLDAIKKWLVAYDGTAKSNGTSAAKSAAGGTTTLAFGGKVLDEAVAMAIVDAHAAAYEALRSNKASKASIASVWIPDAKSNPALMAAEAN